MATPSHQGRGCPSDSTGSGMPVQGRLEWGGRGKYHSPGGKAGAEDPAGSAQPENKCGASFPLVATINSIFQS